MGHKWSAILLFVLYLILLGCMVTNHNMLAMWLMTIGMLVEATINLVDQFRRR